jgi:hypothetical protein
MEYNIVINSSTLPNGMTAVNARVIRTEDRVELGKFLFPRSANESITAGQFIDEITVQGVNHPSFIPNDNYNGEV